MPKKFASTLKLEPADIKSPGSCLVKAQRRRRAVFCLSTAREAIEPFGHGDHVFGLTKGQFSMIDLTAAVLDITGPAEVGLWTWCIAAYEVEAMSAFIADGRITKFRMIMDWSGARRDIPLIDDLQRRFGVDCIRATKAHAKIVTVRNAGWRVVIRGSMNLNDNPRFEQFDVTEGSDEYALVDGVMSEIWARSPAVAVRLSRLQAPIEIQAVLLDRIDEALTELSDGKWHTGKVPEC